MLLIGETEEKSKKLLSSLQSQLQYNKRLINDYGARYKMGDWSNGSFMTTDGCRFISMGFGQNPRGLREEEERPDYIVVDDVDNKRHINNDRLMRQGVEWIFEDLMGCFDETDESTKRFVYANNNFHKNSITNRLRTQFLALASKAIQEKKKPIHKVLSVRAVKDLNSFTPNWPEKTSARYWREKFASTPYRSFMREYMHTHIDDGKVFRMEDMQWKKMLPLKDYDALVFYGDLSYKTQACYKGMILVGKIGREFHIIHTFLRQSSRVMLAQWLYDRYEEDKLEGIHKIKYWIEGLFAMDDFVNDFDAEGDKRGYYIPVRADKRPKVDKYDRIEATQSFFERRNVFFNEEERNTSDQIELIDQYLAFEKGGDAAVDGPDAVEGAFSKLNIVSKRQRNEFRSTQRVSRHF